MSTFFQLIVLNLFLITAIFLRLHDIIHCVTCIKELQNVLYVFTLQCAFLTVVVNSRYRSHSKRTSHRNVHGKQEYLRQLKRMSHQVSIFFIYD